MSVKSATATSAMALTGNRNWTPSSVFGSIQNMESLWRTISPNKHHDWINQRNEAFLNYLPLGDNTNKKKGNFAPSVFMFYSNGVVTSRDNWVYNFSSASLTENMESTITFYNDEASRYLKACEGIENDKKPEIEEFINYDSKKISWSSSLISHFRKMEPRIYDGDSIRMAFYRPFNKQNVYFDDVFIHRPAIARRFFPTTDTKNLAICISGTGASKEFSTLMVDNIPDFQLIFNSQCFPRYRYLSADGLERQAALEMGEAENSREDNIPQETVSMLREQYRDSTIDADAIFYYVYGCCCTAPTIKPGLL